MTSLVKSEIQICEFMAGKEELLKTAFADCEAGVFRHIEEAKAAAHDLGNGISGGVG